MTEGIDISSGGAIAVDTRLLRTLIPRLGQAALRLADAAAELRTIAWESTWAGTGAQALTASMLEARVRRSSERLHETAASVRLMAEAYEIVELRARCAAASGTDPRALVELRRSLAMVQSNQRAVLLAEGFVEEWERTRFAGFTAQAGVGWLLGFHAFVALHGLLAAFPALVRLFGRGTPPPGTTLGGEAPEVQLTPTAHGDAEAPASLEDALARIPDKPAQVRVEKYTMPDGSEEFVVYIAGSRFSGEAEEPWDMASNTTMYLQQEVSASYEATRQALEAAGVEPGAVVHAVGHSQGGMIAGFLEMSGDYDVQTVITAGSPIEPPLGEGVLSVQLRHTDDLASNLSGGGGPGRTGSKDSIVVRRIGDPEVGLQDARFATHQLDRYRDTAAMVDASADPRTRSIDALWRRLGGASTAVATQFHATIAVSTEAPGTARSPA